MPDHVRITDVSPRDGLQNEPGVIPTADKVELIELLADTGVEEVEVTSFVSPKWVPQLADNAAVARAIALARRAEIFSPSLREGAGGRVNDAPDAPITPLPARSRRTMSRAQMLRRQETGPEKELWKRLRARRLAGYRFRRQHPFGPYVLDFYSPSERLVVEVDGRTHLLPGADKHDADRTVYLEQHGLRVVRFPNDAVIENSSGVASTLMRLLRSWQQDEPFPLPPPSGRGSQSPLFSALVPNDRGLQSALDANKAAGFPLISKVSVFTAASETFSQKNTNGSIADTLHRFRPVIDGARTAGLQVRGYLSCVIACPFEGPIAPAKVAEVSRQLIDLGINELDLGDTIGAGTPDSIRAMLKAVDAINPIGGGRVPITLHLHDTFGRAADCVKAALDLGVRSFDGSVAGLGGCPYASTPGKRAPGNIATELLVRTIHESGYTTGVDLDALAEAAAFARRIVAASRAPAGGTP